MGKFLRTFLKYEFWFVNHAATLLEAVGTFAICFLITEVTAGVAARYVFNRPIDWELEIGMSTNVIIFVMPLSLALKNDVFPKVDALTSRLSQKAKNWFLLGTQIIEIVVGSLATASIWRLALNSWRYGRHLEVTTWFPIGLLQTAMVVGMGVMILMLINQTGFTIRNIVKNRPCQYIFKLTLEENKPK